MKEDRKKLIVSLFIVFLMVTSVIGYMFGKDGGQKYKYNDYSFLRKGNEWILKTDGRDFVFDSLPGDVEDINVSFDISHFSGLIEIDTTSDPDDKFIEVIALAQYRLQQTMGTDIFIPVGMTDENEFNLAIISCKDATAFVPVLYFKKSNVTKIELENNCIIAEAKSEIDILRTKDRLLYGLLGIIS